MKTGIYYAIVTYLLWGIFPIYWKTIRSVPSVEIIWHRMVWSFIFVLLVIRISGKWQNFRLNLKNIKDLLPYLFTAILLSINWFTYVWAVNAGYIVETSLGYFINPLVNVLLGMTFLKERLRPWQWFSVLLAGLGIAYLTWHYGSLPWIGLTLAITFGLYGLIKKSAALNSTQGFAVETGIMFVPAMVFILVKEFSGQGALLNQPVFIKFLLVLAGCATGIPLLLFGVAARQINLSTLGFLQYIAPTLQFMIGVLVYKETFTQENLIGFGFIWVALMVFSIEVYLTRRKILVANPYH